MSTFRLFGLAAVVLASSAVPAAAAHIPQSPIDITNPPRVKVAEPTFNYPATNVTVKYEKKEGKWKIHGFPAAGPSLTLGGLTYELHEFHFHTRSEHTLNGNPFAMELHLVHRRQVGLENNEPVYDYVVAGRWMRLGSKSEPLDDFFQNLPERTAAAKDDHPIENLQLSGLLPDPRRRLHYQYDGSLTTGQDPNHTDPNLPVPENNWAQSEQTVKWIMFHRPMQISKEQFRAFNKLYHPDGNAHPVWSLRNPPAIPPPPLHDLKLNAAATVPEPSTVWLLAVAGIVAGLRPRF